MRKNGVNRELKEIVGGVCASDGFFANAISTDKNTGIVSRETSCNNFGVITTEGRYPFAYCHRKGKVIGACNKVMDRYLKGYARAMIFYGKRTNTTLEQAESQALELARAFSSVAKICPDEIAIACTGKLDTKFSVQPFIESMKPLFSGVNRLETVGTACAEAIAPFGEEPMQFSYAFYIGDTVCKIGGIFCGSKRGEATLCMMTTDVKITPEMLQRALHTATAETFGMLHLGGFASPDDCVSIMASGKAGNYIIDRADSEYDKFAYALTSVMQKVCLDLVGRNGTPLHCLIKNATSKTSAKRIAKTLIRSQTLIDLLTIGEIGAQEVLALLHATEEEYDFGKLQISVKADEKEIVVYEERKDFTLSSEAKEQIRSSKQVELILRLNLGNYSAIATGCLG